MYDNSIKNINARDNNIMAYSVILFPLFSGVFFIIFFYFMNKENKKEVNELKSKLAFYEKAKFTDNELAQLKKFLDFIEENQLKNEDKRSIGEAHLYYIRETLEIARKSSGEYSQAWWLCHDLQKKYNLKF